MKKILSFLSYHNAVPAVLIVLTMGAGITFAASQGVLPMPAMLTQSVETGAAQAAPEPKEVDVSTLLATDTDAFDFRPTVTGVVETDSLYTVSYSIETLAPTPISIGVSSHGERGLAPEGSAWASYTKTGEFSVAKDALGDGGLNAYVVGKLRDIENGERLYLARAQTAEKALVDARTAKPANAFAALVGLALDQIFVPVVEKPAPEPQPQTPPVQSIPTPAETVTPASTPMPVATSTPTATSTPNATEPAPVATTTPVATSTPAQTATSTPHTATSTPESIATSTPTQPSESTSTTGTASTTQTQ
ncbi:MAG: hypothetical protein Q8P19_02435 [bacterium]|nr:hypothetical protein [bacterium]